MKLEEAISILENNDYILTERAFGEKDSERVMDVLKEIHDEYVSKGYVVGLYPTKSFQYTVDLGYDPTIGTNYHSWRSKMQTDQEHNLFNNPVQNIARYSPIVLRIVRWQSEEFIKYAEKHFGHKQRSQFINWDPYCIFVDIPIKIESDTEDEVTYKIEDSVITGTAQQLKADVEKLIPELIKQAKKKKYDNVYKKEEEKYRKRVRDTKTSSKVIRRVIANMKPMFVGKVDEEFFKTFDKCREINTYALDIIIAEDAYNKMSDDVPEDYGYSWKWNEIYAYRNDFSGSFLEYLDEHFGGDIRKFAEEYEVNSMGDLQIWYMEDDDLYHAPDEDYWVDDGGY